MKLVAAKCTQCGADINVDASLLKGCCPFCHTEFWVEQVVNNYIANTGEDANNLVKAGEARLLLGDFDVALQKFEKLCDLYPQDYRGWLGLIKSKTENFNRIVHNQSELDEILDFYKKAEIVASGTLDKSFSEVFKKYVSEANNFIADSVSSLQTQINNLKAKQEESKKQFEKQIQTIEKKKCKVKYIFTTINMLLIIPIVILAIVIMKDANWNRHAVFCVLMLGLAVIFSVSTIPFSLYSSQKDKMDNEINLLSISLEESDSDYCEKIKSLEQEIFNISGKKV